MLAIGPPKVLNAAWPTGKPFDEARAFADTTWASRLRALRVDARSDRDRRILYTALHPTAMMPTLASDVDGTYRGIDNALHEAKGFRYEMRLAATTQPTLQHCWTAAPHPSFERPSRQGPSPTVPPTMTYSHSPGCEVVLQQRTRAILATVERFTTKREVCADAYARVREAGPRTAESEPDDANQSGGTSRAGA